ncbi:MAG: DNA translocase FtsK 4TM domain-containing protein [Desulfovibrio sp.]|nr:DNA translocase FtsK 4TM domain-containing protein [Desulfovibrio sp.]MBI4959258.1 DNA translocase FtsK 4TM domain-containing protein [Desulfovibrio sp.]
MDTVTERKKILVELAGVTLIFVALFFVLALYSFDPLDPTFNQTMVKGREVANLTGVLGSYMAGLLADMFGLASWFVPALITYAGIRRLFPLMGITRRHWAGLFGLFLVCLVTLGSDWPGLGLRINHVAGGGYVGAALYRVGARFLHPVGMYLLVTFLAVISLQLFLGISWEEQTTRVKNFLAGIWDIIGPGIMRFLFGPGREEREHGEEDAHGASSGHEGDEEFPVKRPAKSERAAKPKAKPQPKLVPGKGGLPPLQLLTPVPAQTGGPSEDFLRAQAASLMTCLTDFGIQGEVVRIVPGPVVTMFEIKPAPGVKVSRISGLTSDIALAMKAMAIRIEAPIPGRDTVGVEIPNVKRQTVYLREILESEAFTGSASKLTLSVGKDIQGKPFTADLARMPHLLVAGATGSGKSVCINGILLSILYKAQPSEVKLLLIDPKRIELAMYSDLPHLVHPVVTDMAMAKSALDWCVAEMDRRYEAMAALGVRNIDGYNEKAAKLAAHPSPDTEVVEPMPYLVLIIDELADLMMTAAKEVEIAIVRLAQLARASGIHMILATQRPSVDVVTGLIKANFPTRIAFQVTSRHDSRTILDTVGSEHLLGRGDMLFKPSGAKMVRMHGAFVSDEETVRVVDYWKERQAPSYLIDLASWSDSSGGNGGVPGGDGDDESLTDPVYPQALDFVMEQGKASISLIQRRFRIGFNRAARFIEQMERDGLLGPADGSKPRVVLKGKD